uniref:protein acetyllysine N-acetyltransferase n=1 Tax=Globisporangium ultimum (strain ATCC 200006 / CBS 805.95 / DAOM BR144) TaxID=431595 RepID=K3XAV4_GLOUD
MKDLLNAADDTEVHVDVVDNPQAHAEQVHVRVASDDKSENCRAATPSASEQTNAHDELDAKCRRLAELIAKSKHLVAFTGAGISTSVGLPDYRGDNGIRTKGFVEKHKRRKLDSATSSSSSMRRGSTSSSDSESGKQVVIPDFNSLVPSKTHMALYELHRLGYLKHLVSQNVDNLHLKSGLPASALTEVHGNATQAKCETCEKIYTKDFPWTGLCDDPACVSTKRSVEQRLRARTRHGNGRLKRNVISFDEPLDDIDHAIDECEAADVALVLGTSLRVEPFSEMAGEFADALVIVNLQPTTQKLDKRAETSGVRFFEKCDVVMEKTMKFLLGEQYEIPAWSGTHPTSVFIPEHEDKNLVNVLAGRLLA